MACPRCGDVCRCHTESRFAKIRPKFKPHFEPDAEPGATRASAHAVLVEPDAPDVSEEQFEASVEGFPVPRSRFVVDLPPTDADNLEPAASRQERYAPEDKTGTPAALQAPPSYGPALDHPEVAAAVDSLAKLEAPPNPGSWRQEVAARVHRYHSRRKPRGPRYPSLRLKFEASENGWSDANRISESVAHAAPGASRSPAPSTAPWTMAQVLAAHQEDPVTTPSLTAASLETIAPAAPTPADLIGNLIEFPRWNPGPPEPLNILADPVIERPRIIEAPEMTPLPPALGGILIESAPAPEIAKQPGIDLPLKSASLERRLLAAGIDALLVTAASAMFGYVFFRIAAPQLPLLQIAGVGAGLMGVLWGAYQYLFLVHTTSTPGLRLTKLELCRFDGSPAGQRVRRWRVFVSLLSLASLGLGYAWYFLDEDALCWHDRITHTYLGSVARTAGKKP